MYYKKYKLSLTLSYSMVTFSNFYNSTKYEMYRTKVLTSFLILKQGSKEIIPLFCKCTAHQTKIFAQQASYFCDWTCVCLIMSWQKSPKSDFQSQFSMSKISFIILMFVSVKIIRLGVQPMMYQFLITSFFEVVCFLKLGPIFFDSWSSERFRNQILVIFANSWSSKRKSNHKNN